MSDEPLLAFTRALSDAVKSGLPLAQHLRERGFPQAAEAVSAGGPLHKALGSGFSPVFLALVRAGEEGGKLDVFLDRYADALEVRIDFRRKLKRAMLYPAFAALLGLCVFLLFTTKAAPMLLQPLIDAGVEVPAEALRAIAFGGMLLENRYKLLGGLIGAWFAAGFLLGSGPGRKLRALAGHWLPGARYATSEARSAEFEGALELLLSAGLRPREIMEIYAQYWRDDPVLARRLKRGADDLQAGKGFAESLGPCLPEEDRAPVAVAEKAGRLDETLGRLAKGHREKQVHRLKVCATALQLGAVVMLAPMCFGLVMWILLPALALMKDAGKLQAAAPVEAPASVRPASLRGEDRSQFEQSKAASKFNEREAGGVLGYLREHGVPAETKAASAEETAPDGEPKKFAAPRLKARESMRKPALQKIKSTDIKTTIKY